MMALSSGDHSYIFSFLGESPALLLALGASPRPRDLPSFILPPSCLGCPRCAAAATSSPQRHMFPRAAIRCTPVHFDFPLLAFTAEAVSGALKHYAPHCAKNHRCCSTSRCCLAQKVAAVVRSWCGNRAPGSEYVTPTLPKHAASGGRKLSLCVAHGG